MTEDFDARNADRGRAVPMTCRTCEHYDRRKSICKSYDLVIAPEEDGCHDWKEASCTGTEDLDARNERKSRSVCAAMAESADTGKRALSEKERCILDMWPRFEDGEPVWFRDEVEMQDEIVREVWTFTIDVNAEGDKRIYLNGLQGLFMLPSERVKRPAPKVLDADGVPIKVGDTVWHEDGSEWLVEEMNRYGVRCFDGDKRRTFNAKCLTHTRPDSWERLEEDASKEPCFYFGFEDKLCSDGAWCPANKMGDCSKFKAADIVRRAKKLAGVE